MAEAQTAQGQTWTEGLCKTHPRETELALVSSLVILVCLILAVAFPIIMSCKGVCLRRSIKQARLMKMKGMGAKIQKTKSPEESRDLTRSPSSSGPMIGPFRIASDTVRVEIIETKAPSSTQIGSRTENREERNEDIPLIVEVHAEDEDNGNGDLNNNDLAENIQDMEVDPEATENEENEAQGSRTDGMA